MAYVLAAVLGLAFGAGDQYLGTLIWLGDWPATAAQVSAPWLVLPFAVGMTQDRPRRAVALGLVATASALFGYYAMTYSPMEVHPWTFARFADGLVAVTTSGYNPAYIAVGLVTGPIFGFLGQQWRTRRWWVSAALVAGALSLEPLARWATGELPPPAPVWTTEVALGLVIASLFAVAMLASRRDDAISTDPS
ncbi:MAG TPA: DUF6518 family protein [Actinomycetota bacterium]|jgi:hypothetical protein